MDVAGAEHIDHRVIVRGPGFGKEISKKHAKAKVSKRVGSLIILTFVQDRGFKIHGWLPCGFS